MISNASPLIILAKLDIFSEVLKLYNIIEISQEVYKEIIDIGSEKQDAILLNSLYKEGKIKIIDLDNKHFMMADKIIKNYKLDKGEAETIALVLQLKNKEVLMDESLGRRIAKLFDLKPKGTLRVLLELYKENYINEKQLKSKVNELIGKQFRLDAEILNKFWELFGEMNKKS